ncbi:MAG: hypothetical protein HY319_28040 [Armatimonadetes bacterium]|nr:hypothetical protein [Armatimonadota bacterium]
MDSKQMEELSSWLDGEPGSGASSKWDPRAIEDLRLLGEVLREPPLLPRDFASATAAAVLVRARTTPSGWLHRLVPRPAAALSVLLDRLTDGKVLGRLWPVLMVLLFGVPNLLLGLWDPGALKNHLLAIELISGLVVGAYVVMQHGAQFGALRSGGAVEEILSTGVGGRAVVDGFAAHSLALVGRILWPLLLILLPASLITGQAVAAAAWLPLVAALTATGCYAMLGRTLGVFCLVALLGGWWFLETGSLLALVGTSCALILTGLAGRERAARGVENPARYTSRSRARNRWIGSWNDNPVVVRERQRQACRIPAGLAGLLLWRSAALLPLLALGLGVCQELSSARFWIALTGAAMLVFLQAAWRCAGAVVGEREKGTLEGLVGSGLRPERFAAGWLQVGLAEVFGALVTVGVFTAFLIAAAPETLAVASLPLTGLGVIGFGVVLAAAWLGAHVGLQVSTSSTRAQALARLAGLTLRGCVAWLAAWGLLAAVTQWLVLARLIEAGAFPWEAFVQGILPVVSLGLVCAVGLAWTRRSMIAAIEASWGVDRSPDPPATTIRQRLASVLLTAPAVAVAAAVALHAGLFFVSLTRFSLTMELESALNMLLGVAVGLFAGWVVGAQALGFTRLLLERYPRRLLPTCLAVMLCGGVAGALGGLFPAAIRSFLWFEFRLEDWGWLFQPVELGWGYLGSLTGLILGGFLAVVGCALWEARRGERAPTPAALGRSLAWLAFGAVFLVVLFGSFVAMAFDVEVENPALEARVLREVRDRLEAEKRIPDAVNGFAPLHPLLVSRQYGQSVELTLALSQYMTTAEETEQKIKASPHEIREAAAGFETFLPGFREAVARPEFSYVGTLGYGFDSRLPNFILMRRISQSLAVLGLLRESEGLPGEALSHYLLGLRWGTRMSGKGPLITEMIAVSQTAIVLEPLTRLLGRGVLSEQDYRRALDCLNSEVADPAAFGKSMDMEFFLAMKFFDDLKAGEVDPGDMLGPEIIGWMPGFYVEHERAVYTNLYLRHRDDLYALRPAHQFMIDWESYPLSGLLAALVPNHLRAQTQFEALLTRLEAARLLAAIGVYRHQHGRVPERLADLSKLLGRPAVHYIERKASFEYELEGSDFRLWSRSGHWRKVGSKEPVMWFHPAEPPASGL